MNFRLIGTPFDINISKFPNQCEFTVYFTLQNSFIQLVYFFSLKNKKV